MAQDSCYLCKQVIPDQQSFYQDHDVKVCLECFKVAPRCGKCRFPSHQLQLYPGIGKVCEFCQKALNEETGMECYLCHNAIPAWASYYTDYDKYVCQDCFRDAKRCFLCRFPHSVEKVKGLGEVCEFCHDNVLQQGLDLQSFMNPLRAFLKGYRHEVPDDLPMEWVDWNLLVGMQQGASPHQKIKFLDEYLHYCYPVFYMKERFFVIFRIPHQLFMAHLAGQLVCADLCRQYQQRHLHGQSPFAVLARGWSHWVAYNTAKQLQYSQIEKQLRRGFDSELSGDFSKFLAMSEYREVGEIVAFAHQTLKQYAEKYL